MGGGGGYVVCVEEEEAEGGGGGRGLPDLTVFGGQEVQYLGFEK